MDRIQRQREHRASDLGGRATKAVAEAEQQAKSALELGRQEATSRMSALSGALKKVGQQCKDKEPQLANVMERGGERIQRVADYLSERTTDELVRQTEDFARRDPALFLGGAFAFGLIAARFLKSSAPESDQFEHEAPYAGNVGRPEAGTESMPRQSEGIEVHRIQSVGPAPTEPPGRTARQPPIGSGAVDPDLFRGDR